MDGEDVMQGMQGLDGKPDKIMVSVRLRPLNEREISRNDVSDWECINSNTIIFNQALPERSLYPAAYTFDKVFGCNCPTKEVYEEGAKEVASLVVGGINASIFAYGQTSSGKTYTMAGVTEFAVRDIYDYIERHKDREFVLKFSAMEIYNEAVRDLLSSDNGPLRLLDDPERGTVVEKLIEETLRDSDHFQELLSICAAQRQIGETSLNENSSRSHQILRLTVESSARSYLGAKNSSILTASLNFVDLAGSERASQALSTGTRLKEGCHINRSLLTLGTVIRKLSKEKNEHVPYRDSKLTRILQNSLGGNARTAIICTMSPAHAHLEQSRNTLSFAICAKEVTTNAQVNLVMSDKTLVKQLQSELARLNKELKNLLQSTPASSDSTVLLREKELLIEQMDKEIKELIQQRDRAQSRVEDLLRAVHEDPISTLVKYSTVEPTDEVSNHSSKAFDRTNNAISANRHSLEVPENHEDTFLLDDSTPKFSGPDPCHGWEEITQKKDEIQVPEDTCKEVRCIEFEKITRPGEKEKTSYEELQKKVEKMQKAINYLASIYPMQQSPCSSEASVSSFGSMNFSRSKSSKAILVSEKDFMEKMGRVSVYQMLSEVNGCERIGNLSGKDATSFSGLTGVTGCDSNSSMSRKDSQSSITSVDSLSFKGIDVDDMTTIRDYSGGMNPMAQVQSKNRFDENMVEEAAIPTIKATSEKTNHGEEDTMRSSFDWSWEFERKQKEILQLWMACNVALVHRTYFFLLYKGEPSDSVYMEVELRRLVFLNDTFFQPKQQVMKGGQIITPASSLKDLNQERRMLSKQIQKKFSRKEREALYQKWGIGLKSRQRSLRLAHRLWSESDDLNHAQDSAALVAQLIGFVEPGQIPKEIFGLSFVPKSMKKRSYSLKSNLSSLL